MKSTKPGMGNEAAPGSVVPAGRTGFWAGFPGTSCLANIRRRSATLSDQGGKAVWQAGFCRIAVGVYRMGVDFYRIATGFSRLRAGFSRLFPRLPASSRINFCWEMEWWRFGVFGGSGGGKNQDGETRRAELSGKKCGLLQVVTRKFTKVRTDQARNSAMFGFPSPPRVRCPKWVVRLRETWSRLFGLLRVGPFFG